MIRPASIRLNALLLCSLLFSLASAKAQKVFDGTADDGSLYEIVLPTNWNHQLVLYAHGIVDPQAPIALPSNAGFVAFRDALVQRDSPSLTPATPPTATPSRKAYATRINCADSLPK